MIGYYAIGESWTLFAALFLLPDLGMLGYLLGPRAGAAFYNPVHTYLVPVALASLGWSLGMPVLLASALIWAAHIGFDRMMGYGLKYAPAFGATHLGWRGRPIRSAQARGDPAPPGSDIIVLDSFALVRHRRLRCIPPMLLILNRRQTRLSIPSS